MSGALFPNNVRLKFILLARSLENALAHAFALEKYLWGSWPFLDKRVLVMTLHSIITYGISLLRVRNNIAND